MDILTHALSGVAVGTVVAGFSGKGIKENLGIIAIAGFGGMLPDFDAISLWSGFDGSIGKLFGLSLPGKEIYFSKLWYSHHAFLHSLLASPLIAMLFVMIAYLIRSRFRGLSLNNIIDRYRTKKFFLLAFVLGFQIHLFEDMVTPACVWGGVNYLWPLESYIGGTGDIWWWNNYDVFLIVVGVIMINAVILITRRLTKLHSGKLSIIVFVIGFGFAFTQIKTRTVDFNFTGFTSDFVDYEIKSKEIQKQKLGTNLYEFMKDLDNKMKINF